MAFFCESRSDLQLCLTPAYRGKSQNPCAEQHETDRLWNRCGSKIRSEDAIRETAAIRKNQDRFRKQSCLPWPLVVHPIRCDNSLAEAEDVRANDRITPDCPENIVAWL